ncbi:hypothetical protein [Brucella sp. NBRC 12950]|uniref:hypothetical protein n=1 Tax=Brucella sp. NBRC 12950 TaxID=2994518 RepID=UPI002555102C|nr:hypothetical protein [Brucella sp. NBRC 12950]
MQQQADFSYKFQNMRAALNKINYTDQRNRIRLSESLIFLSLAVVFMPASFLRLFSFDSYHLPMLHRIRADVAYLELGNPVFAEAYVGGIFLQFFFCGVASALRVYFSFRSKEIHFVPGEFKVYIAAFLVVTLCTLCCSFIILNVSSFGMTGSHSWFENNISGNLRGMPLPENNFVFMLTGIFMPVAFWPIILLALMIIEAFLGRKITITQLLQRNEEDAGK